MPCGLCLRNTLTALSAVPVRCWMPLAAGAGMGLALALASQRQAVARAETKAYDVGRDAGYRQGWDACQRAHDVLKRKAYTAGMKAGRKVTTAGAARPFWGPPPQGEETP